MRRTTMLLPALIAFLAGASPAHAWTWPADGPVLQPFRFGDDPYAAGLHRGIDVAGPPGAAVRAPAGGSVSFAGSVPGGGRTITIQTSGGYAVTLVHLGAILTRRGAHVAEGDAVATMGSSGTPEHDVPSVHLGIRVAAEPEGYLDPMVFLPARAEPAAVVPPAPGAVADPEPSEPPAPGVEAEVPAPAEPARTDAPAVGAPVAAPVPAEPAAIEPPPHSATVPVPPVPAAVPADPGLTTPAVTRADAATPSAPPESDTVAGRATVRQAKDERLRPLVPRVGGPQPRVVARAAERAAAPAGSTPAAEAARTGALPSARERRGDEGEPPPAARPPSEERPATPRARTSEDRPGEPHATLLVTLAAVGMALVAAALGVGGCLARRAPGAASLTSAGKGVVGAEPLERWFEPLVRGTSGSAEEPVPRLERAEREGEHVAPVALGEDGAAGALAALAAEAADVDAGAAPTRDRGPDDVFLPWLARDRSAAASGRRDRRRCRRPAAARTHCGTRLARIAGHCAGDSRGGRRERRGGLRNRAAVEVRRARRARIAA